MPEPLSIASSIGKQAVRVLLAQRRTKAERSLPLSELVNLTTLDDYKRRGLDREIATIVDAVSERLEDYIKQEWRNLSENDRSAAIFAVCDTFERFNLNDSSLFAADANPIVLARNLRSQIDITTWTNSLGEGSAELYRRLLDESCVLYCQLVVSLAPFAKRGIAELLARTSSLSYQTDLILQRVPLRSLDSPEGEDFDSQFTQRYLEHISSTQDEIELFGVDTNRYTPRATLSLAYISLSATSTFQHETSFTRKWLYSDESGYQDTEDVASNVENLLARAGRILVLGEAGSGKTTLLSWLAVTAARHSFEGDLATWNDRIPLLIKLRQYVDRSLPSPEQFLDSAAQTISDLKPRNWVHRTLASGKALLLVDGIDELPAAKRREVRAWLHSILLTYPNTESVVTARPTAAKAKWLAGEGFSSVMLNRMGRHEVKALIKQWHIAIRDSGNLPCTEEELPIYENSLMLQLETASHLQGLATNPLLCAMLCALNLDRHKLLPPDRMAIYQAALTMLLERRDAERGVSTAEQTPPISLLGKVQLLQYLAWRLSLNGKTEIDKHQAIARFDERLLMIRSSGIDAESAMAYMLSRSGVVREPAVGRIDFVHRTFQEYLTAKEASDNGDIGFLVDRAHLDTWQQTIIMAAGHANMVIKRELLMAILERAGSEKRYSRRLQLLAAACLETAGALEPEVRQAVENCLSALVPPRRDSESGSLARVGSAVFENAPTQSSEMSESAAGAMISTLALIGGPKALDLLSNYALDKRSRIIDRLLSVSPYFQPEDYGIRVLRNIDFTKYELIVTNELALAAFRHIPNIKLQRLQLEDVRDIADKLKHSPPMSELWMSGEFRDLSELQRYAETLTDVTLWSTSKVSSPDVFNKLPLLKFLRIGFTGLTDFSFVTELVNLECLWLSWLDSVKDISNLKSLSQLKMLRLGSHSRMPTVNFLKDMPSIKHLQLYAPTTDPMLAEIAGSAPWLTRLDIDEPSNSKLCSLEGLISLTRLERLEVESESLDNLNGLSQLSNLSEITLNCPAITDLRPLAEAGQLKQIHLTINDFNTVDLSVLKDSPAVVMLRQKIGSRYRDKSQILVRHIGY